MRAGLQHNSDYRMNTGFNQAEMETSQVYNVGSGAGKPKCRHMEGDGYGRSKLFVLG